MAIVRGIHGWRFYFPGDSIASDGVPMQHKNILERQEAGFYAHDHVLEALQYAEVKRLARNLGHNYLLFRVICASGIKRRYHGTTICSQQTILWRLEARDVIRAFFHDKDIQEIRRMEADAPPPWLNLPPGRWAELLNEELEDAIYAAAGRSREKAESYYAGCD